MVLHDLAQWRALISRSFAPLRITADEQTFRAALREVALGDVHLFEMATGPHRVERARDLIDPHARPACKLSLQLSGTAVLTQDDRACRIGPGDLALYVTQRPYLLEYERGEQHSLVIQFPQSFVHIAPDLIGEITATRVSRSEGLGRVAVPLFEQLAHNLDVLSGAHAMNLVRSALDMLVTVLSSETSSVPENPLFQQAVAYIEDHLAEEDLGPQAIATHLYVSVRQLHARFAAEDHTVAAYIRERRLEAIRQALGDPLARTESVSAIGSRCGIPDASHLSKAFRAQFGETPSAYRTRVLAAPESSS
ncbi:Transcriptional activator feaR [Rothia kristinae]|uniref:AraC-like ligand-binding domain-containing protein n=1 Tax=Rothia kristinae TaxID=37923 RepID=UPI0007740173|nr:helix-turn-helix domain-containing protein [Rothia kristinae]SQC37039.1 Transcriptional activator feaR [Rothia kristinae]